MSDSDRFPKGIFRANSSLRTLSILVSLFAIVTFVGCVKYEEYDPCPIGVFYPDHEVTVRGREANNFPSGKSDLYTFSRPVKIVSVGVATYYDPQNAGPHEVARLGFSNGDIYVWTDTLRLVGRI